MSSAREVCSCGASFDGDSAYLGSFRSNHRHEFPPAPAYVPPDPQHIEDQTGYLAGTDPVATTLGFVTPSMQPLGDDE